MRHYTSNTWNKRVADQSIRESILAQISAFIHANGYRLDDIRTLDATVTRPQFQALKDGVDGYLSKDRLAAIAQGLEVRNTGNCVVNGVQRCAA